MSQLEQPPPDLPAPPPGEEAQRSRRIFAIIIWMGAICVLLLLLAYPVVFRTTHRGHGSNRTEAINNMRQIGLELFEFDAEYGQFPDASTVAEVKANTRTSLALDDSSSNMLFRQLLATGVKTEKIFWVRTNDTPRKPDNRFHSDATALERGECVFAYIASLSSADNTDAPLVVAPLEKGKRTFDAKTFQGRALVLGLDNSVTALPIERDGRVLINGMDIFDPHQPFWKGKAPDIKWQE